MSCTQGLVLWTTQVLCGAPEWANWTYEVRGSHGQSRIVDPNGITLEEARVFGQQLLIHDLDLESLFPQRNRMPMAGLGHKVFGAMWKAGLEAVGNRMPIEW